MIGILISWNLEAKAAPEWVPPDLRGQYDRVISSAREYSAILRADPELVGCKLEGEYLIITERRATLESEIKIGPLKGVKSARVSGGKIHIEFSGSQPQKSKEMFKFFGAGMGAGSILTVMCILIIAL